MFFVGKNQNLGVVWVAFFADHTCAVVLAFQFDGGVFDVVFKEGLFDGVFGGFGTFQGLVV